MLLRVITALLMFLRVITAIQHTFFFLCMTSVGYVIVISQAGVGYHCYYTRLRVKPEVEC